jgi:outer membrane protein
MHGMRVSLKVPRDARPRPRLGLAVSLAALACAGLATAASAETIGGALSKAYLNNPNINSYRAAVRATDEGIPAANAGFLPTVQAQGSAGLNQIEGSGLGLPGVTSEYTKPRSYGVNISQNIWNGNKTINSVRQAESKVLEAREQLRYTEQVVLLSGLTYYMDVLRDTAVLDLQKSNVAVLQEQLRQTKDRFNVGEVTRTDVAQAEASLAGAQGTALQAQSNLQTSIANYRQVIGDEPKSLAPVPPLVKPLPRTVTEAIAISLVEHPQIVLNLHGVDVQELAIKISEAGLYPTLGLSGSVTQSFDPSSSITPGAKYVDATVVGTLTIPIYDGGATYAGVRQAKEALGQQELTTDYTRNQVRQAVVGSWGNVQAIAGVIRADKAQVDAAGVALAGVREEAKVGQRTTLDVLNAQQTLLNARVQLVKDQHDQVVDSYTLLGNIGRLSVRNLGMSTPEYDPRVHFDQVKSKLIGLRTPDGK